MAKQWAAHEALSWGMYGDEKQPILNIDSEKIRLPEKRGYDQVRRELRGAIARREVTAHGFRFNGSQPPLAREIVPPGLFEQCPSLAVDADGETTFMHPSSPQNIPQWRKIVFEQNEIRDLWPKPTPDLDAWMRNDFLARPNEKRASRLIDCRAANHCTEAQARVAFKRAPQHLKRGRGQRIPKKTR